MRVLFPFLVVVALILIALLGVGILRLHVLFGVVIPYTAFLIFVIGVIYRVVRWGCSPQPFHIPTTCGQQKSLPWIKDSKIENPSSWGGVIVRMALEVFLFRSLFRNSKTELKEGKVVYGSTKWLWLAGLAFHWSFFIILLRHLRLFTEEVPGFVMGIESLDSFFQVGTPLLYMTNVVFLLAVTYLFLRRIFIPNVRYISLTSDYFPLFLLLSIGITGILMRYFIKVDLIGVKELTMSLVSLAPKLPEGIGVLFYIHLFLVSVLFAYFPFSKLVHMAGIFLSPTRNLTNNSRIQRHINPWDYPVKVHTYEEYEDEFRDKMKKAGIPVEKE